MGAFPALPGGKSDHSGYAGDFLKLPGGIVSENVNGVYVSHRRIISEVCNKTPGYVGNHGFINTGEMILLKAVTLQKHSEVTYLKENE